MDSTVLIALLTLLALVCGSLLKVLWVKVSQLDRELNEERVKMAERFVTSAELDRRLSLTLAPLEQQMARVEIQNTELLALIHSHYRESA